MNILLIREKVSKGVCKDIIYYIVDGYTFMMLLNEVIDFEYKDQIREMFKGISDKDVGCMIFDELAADVEVVYADDTTETYKLDSSFYSILDVIQDIAKAKVNVSKDGMERKCKDLDILTSKRGKAKIICESSLDIPNNYMKYEKLGSYIDSFSGVTGTILRKYKHLIVSVILWEDLKVFGVGLNTGQVIVFNCNEKVYLGVREVTYPGLDKCLEKAGKLNGKDRGVHL